MSVGSGRDKEVTRPLESRGLKAGSTVLYCPFVTLSVVLHGEEAALAAPRQRLVQIHLFFGCSMLPHLYRAAASEGAYIFVLLLQCAPTKFVTKGTAPS